MAIAVMRGLCITLSATLEQFRSFVAVIKKQRLRRAAVWDLAVGHLSTDAGAGAGRKRWSTPLLEFLRPRTILRCVRGCRREVEATDWSMERAAQNSC